MNIPQMEMLAADLESRANAPSLRPEIVASILIRATMLRCTVAIVRALNGSSAPAPGNSGSEQFPGGW